jgi:micrococcal nuclease
MRPAAAFILILFLAVPAQAEEAYVLRVIDGDSLRIELRGLEMDLRLLGVDAPEWDTPGGPKAKEFVQAWVDKAGGVIDLEFDRHRYGKYGRLLAWVWHDGHLLQEDMIHAGHAEIRWLKKDNKHYSRLAAAKE